MCRIFETLTCGENNINKIIFAILVVREITFISMRDSLAMDFTETQLIVNLRI
ncbi:hypothetical protein VIBNISFn27_180016 [Vibrio nigripulchritudo SFn27]|nr:hypothetical protein VIBNIBLFn1_110028 [Vibrio nigripulchritudo BLFn1]CCN87839.1 hypothetical protein VIBNISFn27_180016 [Vibrio nigripulchritudo SFn27]CCN93732.1 hypothetical protein VIBNIENn2_300028 [Vibrio nigripulchritudo ENn2]CCO43103.1 hypothetical protein VIBNISFn135_920028 [Vibrio nigripulchritudo SFn135]CCO52522.1 hypothetical protein VIBNIWn13_340016 [Vibrio nigripulchritudo Wn13]